MNKKPAAMKAQPQGKEPPGPAGQTGDLQKFVQQMRYWAELTNPGVGYDQGNWHDPSWLIQAE
jgi:hypothetical protein